MRRWRIGRRRRRYLWLGARRRAGKAFGQFTVRPLSSPGRSLRSWRLVVLAVRSPGASGLGRSQDPGGSPSSAIRAAGGHCRRRAGGSLGGLEIGQEGDGACGRQWSRATVGAGADLQAVARVAARHEPHPSRSSTNEHSRNGMGSPHFPCQLCSSCPRTPVRYLQSVHSSRWRIERGRTAPPPPPRRFASRFPPHREVAGPFRPILTRSAGRDHPSLNAQRGEELVEGAIVGAGARPRPSTTPPPRARKSARSPSPSARWRIRENP